ncbi:hypothetical protein [Sagittula sp. S175]|uniref:hypothetical protein n=1 Tax=Sagittula sp. S175 TaxID=3415129 RepID=UPI003C7D1EBC
MESMAPEEPQRMLHPFQILPERLPPGDTAGARVNGGFPHHGPREGATDTTRDRTFKEPRI